MTTEISRKIKELLAQEMGPMGIFILKKQCKDLGIDPENIKTDDIPRLANVIYNAIYVFTGEEKGKKIEREIRKMGPKIDLI